MPSRTRNAPIVFVTAKLNAPCSGAALARPCSAVSANAATLISSKKTNMLKRSPVSAKPAIAPQKTSIRTWYRCCDVLDVAPASRAARASDERSREERRAPAPDAIDREARCRAASCPARGCQPPNQYVVRSRRDASEHERRERGDQRAAAIATSVRRAVVQPLAGARAAPPPSSGTATTSGMSGVIPSGRRSRRDRASRWCSYVFDREREQQCRDGDADDDVGERQRLHDRVDDGRARRDVGEDRRGPVLAIADREQQHVGRRLARR